MGYTPRVLDSLLDELVAGLPATLILGPRAVGKTTSAARLAATVVRLDRDEESALFRADPDAALQNVHEPVLLDEWQAVPEVLGAIKRSVDVDSRPGRFLVTGSVRARLREATWPGTGRLVTVRMYGMTVREQLRRMSRPLFLDRLAAGESLALPEDVPNVRGYVDLALRSGFPEALSLTPQPRRRWLNSYVDGQHSSAQRLRLYSPTRACWDPVWKPLPSRSCGQSSKLARATRAYTTCATAMAATKWTCWSNMAPAAWRVSRSRPRRPCPATTPSTSAGAARNWESASLAA